MPETNFFFSLARGGTYLLINEAYSCFATSPLSDSFFSSGKSRNARRTSAKPVLPPTDGIVCARSKLYLLRCWLKLESVCHNALPRLIYIIGKSYRRIFFDRLLMNEQNLCCTTSVCFVMNKANSSLSNHF